MPQLINIGQEQLRINTSKVFLVLILGIISSCSVLDTSSGWVKTDDDILLWLSNCDTTQIYAWDGDIFDNVANGKGSVSMPNSEGSTITQQINAFFGTIDNNEVISLDDGSKYVGNIIDDMMEGYGVLSKGNETYIGYFHNSKPEGFLKWFKNAKLYYEGNWKEGAFNGEGTLYKDDGKICSGEWVNGKLTSTLVDVELPTGHYKGYAKNGKPHGLGHMVYTNGTTYTGKWKDGQWSGKGLYICNTDSVFATWENGKVNGDVIYKTDEMFYEGTFIDNMPVGIGTLATSDGSFYSGNWIDGKRCGIGEMFFANGDKYSGEWENNIFEGYGEYKYAQNNSQYSGNWKDGLQDGDGTYKSPEFTYEGKWEKGWMDGDGILVFKNKDRYEGTVHENIIDGIGSYIYSNGNIYEGEFVGGNITGNGVFQFKNGNRYEGEFFNGHIFGDGTMYLVQGNDTVSITGFWPIDGSFPKEASIQFANGDIYEGPLVNGQPTVQGTWISGKERQSKIDKIENSAAHKANEFYKAHRKTINWCILGVSAVVTAVEVAAASTFVGTPVAAIMEVANIAINSVDAGMAIASAAIDVAENAELGEDNDEALKNLGTEVAMNAAFILVPKVISKAAKPLGKAVKNVTRSSLAEMALKTPGKILLKKSALKFVKGKIVGKALKISVSVQSGIRKIEKALIRNKNTRSAMIATGRLLTRVKHQTVKYSTYLSKIKSNPAIKDQLKMSVEGSSKNLGDNMRLLGTDNWVKRNERIRRYLNMPKRQVEPHHIIPSIPTTERGKQARKIWTKYFGSVDHPCNGIWLGRSNKQLGYKALAKGSNHSPNSIQYEEYVSNALIQTYKKYQKQYAKNPEMMQKVLVETVDNIKGQLYKGNLAIGTGSHQVHTIWSIFKESQGAVTDAAKNVTQSVFNLAIQ